MTYTIQNATLIFHYNEAVLESRNTVMYNTLVGQLSVFKEKGIKGIFVSLKNAPYSPLVKEDIQLSHLVKQLEKLSQVLHLGVAIGDYRKELYPYLRKVSASSSVKLFQNFTIALLFFNPTALKKDLGILIYDEDSNNAEQLCKELVKANYSIVHASNAEDYKHKVASKQYDVTITHTTLNNTSSTAAQSLGLSKQLVMNLPILIDTAVNSLVTITGLEAQKVKHEISPFNEKISPQVIIAAMKFKGDVSGIFFLLFPRDLAVVALEAMIGDSIDPEDTAALIDGVAELCNIITGATKALFSNKNIQILFELPKTYTSLQVAQSDTVGSNGVWINMQLDGKPFYMFVTK